MLGYQHIYVFSSDKKAVCLYCLYFTKCEYILVNLMMRINVTTQI